MDCSRDDDVILVIVCCYSASSSKILQFSVLSKLKNGAPAGNCLAGGDALVISTSLTSPKSRVFGLPYGANGMIEVCFC